MVARSAREIIKVRVGGAACPQRVRAVTAAAVLSFNCHARNMYCRHIHANYCQLSSRDLGGRDSECEGGDGMAKSTGVAAHCKLWVRPVLGWTGTAASSSSQASKPYSKGRADTRAAARSKMQRTNGRGLTAASERGGLAVGQPASLPTQPGRREGLRELGRLKVMSSFVVFPEEEEEERGGERATGRTARVSDGAKDEEEEDERTDGRD